jgi:hypothetical protein
LGVTIVLASTQRFVEVDAQLRAEVLEERGQIEWALGRVKWSAVAEEASTTSVTTASWAAVVVLMSTARARTCPAPAATMTASGTTSGICLCFFRFLLAVLA